jgi:hypothetical protein
MEKVLKAWLKKNHLTPDPNDFTASAVSSGSVGVKNIIDELVNEGMELKRETVLDIITRFNRKAADLVLSGYNVNTGLVYMRSVIKGQFFGKTWNPELNSVYVSITQGLDLRQAVADTRVEILGEQADLIELLSITDSTTGKTDGTLTRGRNVELKGSLLKVVGDHPACGISFMNTATQAITMLDKADIVLNEPSRLLIIIPATIEAGEYELTVSTQFAGGGNNLKQPRSVTLGIPVVVNSNVL